MREQEGRNTLVVERPDTIEEQGDQSAPARDPEAISFALDIRKLVISAFIVWQVFAVTVWLLPERAPRAELSGIVSPYLMFTGTWQQWTMFSPNPANADTWVEARIDYADGTHRSWDYMRMANLGYVQRYDNERFRKMLENAHQDTNDRMWPYLARYAAIVNDRHRPGTYPMTVHIVRHFRVIAPPPLHISPWSEHIFYSHTYERSPLARGAAPQ